MEDPDEGVRVEAAKAYWAVSGNVERPVKLLREVLKDPENGLAPYWAAEALVQMGPVAKEAVPELIAALKSETRHVRETSAEALGQNRSGREGCIARVAATSRGPLFGCSKDGCRSNPTNRGFRQVSPSIFRSTWTVYSGLSDEMPPCSADGHRPSRFGPLPTVHTKNSSIESPSSGRIGHR